MWTCCYITFIVLRYLASFIHLLSIFHHESLSNFIKCFLCICGNDHVFPLHSVNAMHHTYWFVFVQSSLHLEAKSHLFTVMSLLIAIDLGLLVFCWGLLHLCPLGKEMWSSLLIVVLVWLYYQSEVILITMSFGSIPTSSNYFMNLRRIGINSTLGVW
jgi:hypothetical protein